MFDQLINFLQFSNLVSFFIKAFGIALAAMYVLFCFIVVKQVIVMDKAIEVNDRGILTIVAYIGFILSLFILFFSIFIL